VCVSVWVCVCVVAASPQCERVKERMSGAEGEGAATLSVRHTSVQLTCFATLLYAREGWAAPPSALVGTMVVRQHRAVQRSLGLQCLRSAKRGLGLGGMPVCTVCLARTAEFLA
jgi:hypothetical protein